MKTGFIIMCLILFISPIELISQTQQQSMTDTEGTNSKAVMLLYHLDKGSSQFTIKGTSSLHDWEMVSETFEGSLESKDTSGGLLTIEAIDVSVTVTSLVSGKRIMDKKCHAALKYEEHPKIRYRFESMENLKATGNGNYTATLSGLLTVAGKTNAVKIAVVMQELGNRIHITGEKPLKMSDFDVTPPTALLGTLKTGNDITILFNLNYLRS